MLNPRRSRALCALAAAGALVAFTGCGGSDKKTDTGASTSPAPATTSTPAGGPEVAQYKQDFLAAATKFKDATTTASQEVQAATDTAGKVKGLESLKAAVTTAADDFAALKAPASVKPDNDELVSGFRAFAADVDAVEQALRSNDKAAGKAAAQKLTEDQTKIKQTLANIQAKVGS
jgi:soluble cytochrome b562